MSSIVAFWALSAVMVGGALAFVLAPTRRRANAAEEPDRAASNAAIYRSQLADLEEELALGILTPEQHAQAADDVRRRLLSEAGIADHEGPASRAPELAVALALPLAAVGLYLALGAPEAIDQSAAPALPAVAGSPADGDLRGFADKLETHLRAAPRDGRAWALLGRARLALDEFDSAAAAYGQGLAVSPKLAADPLVWCEYADALGMAQGGALAGKPRELIDRALALRSDHPRALEMAGSAEYEAGRYDRALFFWERLLSQLAPGSAEHGQLAAAIARARRLAGMG